MTRSAGCYEIRGQTGEKCNKIFPPRKHPQKSPECQAFGGGKSQALDRDMPELLCSGHPFPKENYNINKLFDTYGEIAADY